ncbi:MAG: hypothetical protein FE044_01845 [Thermoplasmata archaeon]|nr:MAG: hypothetical protein FE044_01845 [Thermoplasmata archaeon]
MVEMYALPKEEEIRNALYSALRKNKSFPSLVKLREAVIKELKKMNPSYTISMRRARVIAARSGFVKISAKMRASNKKLKVCPICGAKLEPIKNYSLLGEEVIIGYKCKLCSYKAGIKNEMPVRYSFQLVR